MPNPIPDKTTAPSPGPSGGEPIAKVKADASALKAEAQNLAGSIADEASTQAGHIADEAKTQAAAAVEKAKGLAGEQKDLLAVQIGGVADAMQRVAGDLEANSGSSAQYARMIADNAERLSSTIKNNDVDALLNMAQDFGRRQPAAFVGVAALLGFAASRFLLASRTRATTTTATGSAATDDADATGYSPTGTPRDSDYSNGRL